jgi:alpha-glucosidase
VREYEEALPKGGWPNWVLGNHDQPRIAARVGAAQARVAAMLLLTLRGTPTMYYGDEIGLGRVEIPPERVQDPWEKNEPGLGIGRDPERTPMQWDGSPKAGFTAGEPWLPFDVTHETCNVENLAQEPGSILTLYRRLIALRRQSRALSIGSFHPVDIEGQVFSYERREGAERLMVALNLGHEARTIAMPADAPDGVLQLSTCLDHEEAPVQGSVALRPDEGVLLKLGRKA